VLKFLEVSISGVDPVNSPPIIRLCRSNRRVTYMCLRQQRRKVRDNENVWWRVQVTTSSYDWHYRARRVGRVGWLLLSNSDDFHHVCSATSDKRLRVDGGSLHTTQLVVVACDWYKSLTVTAGAMSTSRRGGCSYDTEYIL